MQPEPPIVAANNPHEASAVPASGALHARVFALTQRLADVRAAQMSELTTDSLAIVPEARLAQDAKGALFANPDTLLLIVELGSLLLDLFGSSDSDEVGAKLEEISTQLTELSLQMEVVLERLDALTYLVLNESVRRTERAVIAAVQTYTDNVTLWRGEMPESERAAAAVLLRDLQARTRELMLQTVVGYNSAALAMRAEVDLLKVCGVEGPARNTVITRFREFFRNAARSDFPRSLGAALAQASATVTTLEAQYPPMDGAREFIFRENIMCETNYSYIAVISGSLIAGFHGHISAEDPKYKGGKPCWNLSEPHVLRATPEGSAAPADSRFDFRAASGNVNADSYLAQRLAELNNAAGRYADAAVRVKLLSMAVDSCSHFADEADNLLL